MLDKCYKLKYLMNNMELERRIIDLENVKAEISFISPNGVCAIITEPEKYRGIKVSSLYIPYFAMVDKGRWYSLKGELTTRGINAISSSIQKTFNELEIFNLNKQEIKNFYEKIPEIKESDQLKKGYNEKKKFARVLFKSKKIDDKKYQRELREIEKIRKRFESIDLNIQMKLDEFVSQKFGIFMTYNSHELLIEIIK